MFLTACREPGPGCEARRTGQRRRAPAPNELTAGLGTEHPDLQLVGLRECREAASPAGGCRRP